MPQLTRDDFTVGDRFDMEVGDTSCPVELIDASPLIDSGREGGAFRLEFLGPCEPAFQQGTFLFRRNGEALEIFVTAIGRDQSGTRYEAVFF
ncbi:MAG: hypothetical protein QOC65_1120 [Sphingomonadales bacterium]|nr:hypothetical protein [Sphingomonadales bacterium]